ncbi:MAG: hypothetical protein MJ169_05330 [Treponema sp.]|nr:hypothetical protein [Treponema sp.]
MMKIKGSARIMIFCASILCSCATSRFTSPFAVCLRYWHYAESELSLTVKNTGSKNISSIVVSFTASSPDSEIDDDYIELFLDAVLEPSQEQKLECNVSDCLGEYILMLEESGADTQNIYIRNLFIKKVIFEDGTYIEDKYGNYSI